MLYKSKTWVDDTMVKTCISPEKMHREQREVRQESSDESTRYRNRLGLAGARGFDFRRLMDGLARRGRDINMSASLRGPRVKQESLPRLRVQAHGAEEP